MAFAAGDIVVLKSGGPPMTVVSVGEDEIDCVWCTDDGDFFRESIPTVALETVDHGDDDLEDEDDEERKTA